MAKRAAGWIAPSLALTCLQCAQIAGLEDHRLLAGSSGFRDNGAGGDTDQAAGPSDGGSASAGGVSGSATAGRNEGGSAGTVGASKMVGVPSCQAASPGAGKDCGASKSEDCCGSLLVEAGPYQCLPLATNVEPFRLDEFEITVGRFRAFTQAVEDGWRPLPRQGAHPEGANHSAADTGWDPAWNERLPSGLEGDTWLDHFLKCDTSTWTQQNAPDREWLPISCVTWFEATAFCIWDGGYLPSALELSYAAQGGSNEWKYPWGNAAISPERAVYAPAFEQSSLPVGSLPAGNGRWGQADLAGNVWEWCSYNSAQGGDCEACRCDTFREFPNGRTFGGSYEAQAEEATSNSVARIPLEPGLHLRDVGIRCARAP